MDSKDSYRNSGEFELLGREKLPPTEITEDAQESLKQMGLSEEQITALREFTASFRYDLCVEKVKRIAENPVYIDRNEIYPDHDAIDIPHLYDVQGRLDGQCGDIARQFIIQSAFTGILEDLNLQAALPDGHELVTAYCTGLSKTHFSQEGSNHLWNGLAQFDENGDVVRRVLIDAAFQVIATPEESGYTQKSVLYNIDGVKETTSNARVKLGWIKVDEYFWEGNVPTALVIGVSSDRQYAYSLGFMRRLDEGKEGIVTTLQRKPSSGANEYWLINPDTGGLSSSIDNEKDVPNADQDEIREILETCAGFRFTDDLSTYPSVSDDMHTISW